MYHIKSLKTLKITLIKYLGNQLPRKKYDPLDSTKCTKFGTMMPLHHLSTLCQALYNSTLVNSHGPTELIDTQICL